MLRCPELTLPPHPPPFPSIPEIMQTCLSEAYDSYPKEIIVEMPSNVHSEMEDGAEKVKAWVEQWVKDHSQDN